MLEGILGSWGGQWRPARERTLTAVTQEKHLLFLCLTCSVDSFGFFSFLPQSVVVINFVATPWRSPGKNTGMGSLSLFQGIFPAQGSNPGFPHCRWILYQLSHKESPRILEWVAYPFSSGSSWPRNRARVSCIAGGLFTNWAMKEALLLALLNLIKILSFFFFLFLISDIFYCCYKPLPLH